MAEKETKEKKEVKKMPKLLTELAEAAGLDAQRYFNVIVRTVLKKKGRDGQMALPSTEEVYAFLMVCRKYDLDPLLKQIHGFVGKDGQIVPIVGIDGWVKTTLKDKKYGIHRTTSVLQDPETSAIVKILENPETGMRDIYIEPEGAKVDLNNLKPVYSVTAFRHKGSDEWVIGEPEWFSECVRSTTPWSQMPRRMLAHKSFMQAARKAFGIGGIYDSDEANDIRLTQEGGGPARGIVDATPSADEEPDRQALGAPVTAGNIDEHTGHQDETGAAEQSAADLAAAKGESAPEPPPTEDPEPSREAPHEQPDLPAPKDDPGHRCLGDIDAKVYAKTLRVLHAARKKADYSDDEFKDMYKKRYKVGTMKKMTIVQAGELLDWLKDNPKRPPEDDDDAPPTEEEEATGAEEGATETPEEAEEEEKEERGKYLEAMREYQQMFPSDCKQVLQDDFNDKALTDLTLEELKRFNKLLEARLEPAE